MGMQGAGWQLWPVGTVHWALLRWEWGYGQEGFCLFLGPCEGVCHVAGELDGPYGFHGTGLSVLLWETRAGKQESRMQMAACGPPAWAQLSLGESFHPIRSLKGSFNP